MKKKIKIVLILVCVVVLLFLVYRWWHMNTSCIGCNSINICANGPTYRQGKIEDEHYIECSDGDDAGEYVCKYRKGEKIEEVTCYSK